MSNESVLDMVRKFSSSQWEKIEYSDDQSDPSLPYRFDTVAIDTRTSRLSCVSRGSLTRFSVGDSQGSEFS